jgi:peptide-methionine (S)-S-oxide reductase
MNLIESFGGKFRNNFLTCALVGYWAMNGLVKLDAAQLASSTRTTTKAAAQEKSVQESQQNSEQSEKKIQTATLGAGCFWCSEAVFARLKGVESVKSGYMGGQIANPTYQQVCTGMTGHAEVIQIRFDPDQITFAELLEVFWKTHDPTTLNQQGNDYGTQYRSVVFYHSEDQKQEALHYMQKLVEVEAFRKPIVTEITAASDFYVAEDYHQEYFKNNPRNPYCRAVIPPKLKKLRAAFGDKLKEDPKKKKKSEADSSKPTPPRKPGSDQN